MDERPVVITPSRSAISIADKSRGKIVVSVENCCRYTTSCRTAVVVIAPDNVALHNLTIISNAISEVDKSRDKASIGVRSDTVALKISSSSGSIKKYTDLRTDTSDPIFPFSCPNLRRPPSVT